MYIVLSFAISKSLEKLKLKLFLKFANKMI